MKLMSTAHSNLAETIKETVSMDETARVYGFEPNKSGFISCPIHGEKTPSLKLYPNKRGWYCFGCGVGGDVINFVEHVFNLSFRQAIVKINYDFSLGLPMGRPQKKSEQSKLLFEAHEKERIRKINREYELMLFSHECGITSRMNQCEIIMAEHPPVRHGWDADYPEEWVSALKEMDKLRMELYNNECEQRRHREVVNKSND